MPMTSCTGPLLSEHTPFFALRRNRITHMSCGEAAASGSQGMLTLAPDASGRALKLSPLTVVIGEGPGR